MSSLAECEIEVETADALECEWAPMSSEQAYRLAMDDESHVDEEESEDRFARARARVKPMTDDERAEYKKRADERRAAKQDALLTALPVALTPPGSVGDAARLVHDHEQDVRYVEAAKTWYIWDSTRWAEDRELRIHELAKRTAHKYLIYGAKIKDQDVIKQAIALHGSRRKMLDMIDLAKSDPRVARSPEEFDRSPMLLNCPNGTVDLTTGTLKNHDRNDHLTQMCATEYDPTATCPTWESFLDSVFAGDAELIGYMRRLLGYAVTGSDAEDVFPIFFGGGSNGKSTLTETMESVLGRSYVAQLAEGVLTSSAGGSNHTTDIADLKGKRVAFASETDDGAGLKKALMKRLTGGGTMVARHLYQRNQEFSQTWTIFLQTNHKPSIPGGTHGEWRRVKLIPFAVRFWDGDDPAQVKKNLPANLRADKTLGDRLKAEAKGILSWLVRGCLEWQRDGLQTPTAVSSATEEYRSDEDVFAEFLGRLQTSPGVSGIKCSDAYRIFRKSLEGVCPDSQIPSARRFVKALEEAGHQRDAKRIKWMNVELTQ